MNSLLLTLTAVLILVLSALFAAPLFIDWNDYRSVFERQATNLLGRQVKVDGKVHLVLLPAPELRFDDVKVADEAGRLDRPFLAARSIEAWLNFGSLLSGTIEARKIAIVDPVLRLDLKADGSGNWGDVGRKGVALPFAPNNLMLDSMSVSGGRIELTREGKPALALDAVTGEASAASLSGPYKLQATYLFDERSQELRVSTSEPDAQGLFRLKAVLRDAERDATYSLDGGVSGGAKPEYDGSIIVRIAKAAEGEAAAPAPDSPDAEPAAGSAAPSETPSFLELKGPLKVTPERAEIPDFDLTIHAKGRPQILKGKLDLALAEPFKTDVELSARFVDLDTLFGSPDAEQRPSPASVLYMFADQALGEAGKRGDGSLAVTVEQANLGGDLVGGLDVALAVSQGTLKIERLQAMLPGDNRLDVSGRLSHGAFGPVFVGPVRIAGSGLRTLTRWAVGDRDMSGQASMGAFVLSAKASVGDGKLELADVAGELSETKFSGALRYQGGQRNLLELSLDSDRLDLREMIGEEPIWSSWLAATKQEGAATGQDLLSHLRNEDMRVTLNVGELLLPNAPPGKLDARFTLLDDTLNVEKLDFAAANAIALNGKGRIESVSKSPSGGADFALKAETTDSLRLVSGLFGLPKEVSGSKHLSALAPLDIRVGLVAAREGAATKASLEIGGKAAGSDVALVMRATGEPDKLADAAIDINGSVTGERPQALLVLLFPELPQERMAEGQSQGTLLVTLRGVPRSNVAGTVALKTTAMQLGFNGQGSLQGDTVALKGKTAIVTRDASLAIMMTGLEAPPSAAGVPLDLTADIVKQAGSIDLTAIKGKIAGEAVEGSAHFDSGGAGTKFTLAANAGDVSLPSLLGVLVAWQRTPSTEAMLGTINASGAEVWPVRGFSLGELENVEGEITLTAKTLALGDPFSVSGATLLARVDKSGLAVTELKGRLFGGVLVASGTLQPRGAGAELEAQAGLTGARLEQLSKSLAGSSLAQGPFDLTFNVQGEGLSPPGLVAGLSGEGTLVLGSGALQSLNSEPLRRVAAKAAKKIKADKSEVAAEARAVRETLTKGRYKYAPTRFAFEVKNGTLRLKPALLSGAGAETKINAYVELASMKLDSEWVMSLAGGRKDVPPVSLVFVGPLSKAADITPAIDTAAIESYLTVRRMQEDVEKLENLDVTGKHQPQAEDVPSAGLPWAAEPPDNAAPPDRPTAETQVPGKPQLQSGPPDDMLPPATEVQMPVPAIEPALEAPPETSPAAPAPTETASPAAPTIESLLGPPTEVAFPVPEEDENPAVLPAETQAPAPAETTKPAEPTIETLLAPAPAEAPAPAAPAADGSPPATETAMPVPMIEEKEPAAPFIQSSPPAPAPTDTALPAPPPAESAPVAAPLNNAIPAAVAPAPRVTRPRPTTRKPARARRDDWKKGISVFGGG